MAYIAYWSFRDPLFQSQGLPVIRALAENGWRLAVVTFEQPQWRLPPEEQDRVKDELAGEGIRWHPLTYRKRPRLLSTAFDIATGIATCLVLVLRHRARAVHGRGTVPGAIAYVTSRLTGARLFTDADGPLSQEYVDARLWRSGSVPHRLVSWFERRSLLGADAVAVLTQRRREEVRPLARVEVAVLPCAVDLERFAPAPEAGRRLREELDLRGHILVYAGKTGGWYLTEPMLDFVTAYREAAGETTLLVLTPEEPEQFLEPCRRRGLPCVVRRATREEMPLYLSAADAGLSFRLSTPSQSACSPVKNGEYLACGLPVVTTSGIGDYTQLIAQKRVGVVVTALDSVGMQRAATALAALLKDASLAQRCRDTARDAVGFREVVLPRYLEIYERLLTRPAGRGI